MGGNRQYYHVLASFSTVQAHNVHMLSPSTISLCCILAHAMFCFKNISYFTTVNHTLQRTIHALVCTLWHASQSTVTPFQTQNFYIAKLFLWPLCTIFFVYTTSLTTLHMHSVRTSFFIFSHHRDTSWYQHAGAVFSHARSMHACACTHALCVLVCVCVCVCGSF